MLIGFSSLMSLFLSLPRRGRDGLITFNPQVRRHGRIKGSGPNQDQEENRYFLHGKSALCGESSSLACSVLHIYFLRDSLMSQYYIILLLFPAVVFQLSITIVIVSCNFIRIDDMMSTGTGRPVSPTNLNRVES
jgi:hypothetical protein